ncbi:hypothetical protein [Sutcliffiella sp. NC1]|uniref:hypothetical protein n=1 Tax=Sutcliffiella sp. NC1 TaxID=3004096 RepID=UPI0022DD5FF3|nr:hypothetical protein [Sutcliffiella sp. NC1]WBL17037.1 hypothetical protein O1A01_10560 [Sutcliffiella sp. NC1]
MTRWKRYWILMPPFFITMLLVFFLLPNPYKGLLFVVPLLFWITLSIWNYIGDRKKTIGGLTDD